NGAQNVPAGHLSRDVTGDHDGDSVDASFAVAIAPFAGFGFATRLPEAAALAIGNAGSARGAGDYRATRLLVRHRRVLQRPNAAGGLTAGRDRRGRAPRRQLVGARARWREHVVGN